MGSMPLVMDHELQVGSNGLVSKIEDLEAYHKIVSCSSTTFSEHPVSRGDGQEV